MKNLETAKKKNSVKEKKERRYFTIDARKAIVKEIDEGLSKSEAGRRYEVSQTSIFKWIKAYSAHYTAPVVKVIEHKSSSIKVLELERELEKAQALIGRLSIMQEFLNFTIKAVDEEYGIDAKKKAETTFFSQKSKR